MVVRSTVGKAAAPFRTAQLVAGIIRREDDGQAIVVVQEEEVTLNVRISLVQHVRFANG